MFMKRRDFLMHQAFALLGVWGPCASALAGGWREGGMLPEWDGLGLEGTWPERRGRVLYVDFWASWCAPCKASFPVLDRWYAQWKAKGLEVIGVSVDEDAGAMAAFLKKVPVRFPVVRDAQQKLVAAANVDTMPTAFLVDRKGRIRHVHQGFRAKDEAELAERLAGLLAER